MNESRKTSHAAIAVAAGAGLAAAVAILFSSTAAQAARKDAQTTRVERGKYLVTAMGCNDCHTPWKMGAKGPEPDMTRMLSGHPQDFKLPPAPAAQGPWIWTAAATNTAFAGPWGVSYAANLTPDQNTGLAIWREEDFVKAIRTGQALRRVARDPAPDAVVRVPQPERRGPEGHLRLPPDDSARLEPRARPPAARRGPPRRREEVTD